MGWVKGEPLRFVFGHAKRVGRAPVEEDRGYSTPCLIWQGRPTKEGYGRTTRGGRTLYAHRAAWNERFGEIPAGHDVHHHCEVRLCVNVDHLEALPAEVHRTPNLGRRR